MLSLAPTARKHKYPRIEMFFNVSKISDLNSSTLVVLTKSSPGFDHFGESKTFFQPFWMRQPFPPKHLDGAGPRQTSGCHRCKTQDKWAKAAQSNLKSARIVTTEAGGKI